MRELGAGGMATVYLAHDVRHDLALFDSGEADGFVFYVMPYVEGESLRARITREQQLPVDDAVRITREVADALEYAHQHGIVHRDIKPENIVLSGRQLSVCWNGMMPLQQCGTPYRCSEVPRASAPCRARCLPWWEGGNGRRAER